MYGSKIHTLATLSLVVSIAFANALVIFISDMYTDYILAKFKTKKAWSITSELACRIILHVATPCIGIQKMFRAETRGSEIGESIFWPTLKALDNMEAMININSCDSPIVASELVIF